jgi:hypothetical protein
MVQAYMGVGICAYFGVPAAHEDDPGGSLAVGGGPGTIAVGPSTARRLSHRLVFESLGDVSETAGAVWVAGGWQRRRASRRSPTAIGCRALAV